MTALLTPFTEDGQIHETGLRQLVRHNRDMMKVDGLYVGGSTGEGFLMNISQRKKLFEIVKDEAGSNFKLTAQIGSLNIEEALELAAYCESLQYDAVSAITPYYYQFSFDEIYDYYVKLTEATSLPMIIYSNPSYTGAHFTLEQYGKLLHIPGVTGVKYTDSDLEQFKRLKETYPSSDFYSGSDEMYADFLEAGADGAIGSTYTLYGRQTTQIRDLFLEGKKEEARKLQLQVKDEILKLVAVGIYPSLKYALTLQDMEAGFMKFPFKNLTDAEKRKVEAVINESTSSNSLN